MEENDKNRVIRKEYKQVNPQEAIFGSTIILFGDMHSVNFFGRSQDGTTYVFSKQGPNVAPEVTPVTNLVGGQPGDNDGNANYGFVGNPTALGGEADQYAGMGTANKDGQQVDEQQKKKKKRGTGYFNPL